MHLNVCCTDDHVETRSIGGTLIVGALVTWAIYTQVTKAPTIITKVPRSVPGSTRVITHRGVFRLRAGVQK